MSRGARRAGTGRGTAAVRLLVTLSLLPGVVEAQVSRRWRGGRAARGWPRGDLTGVREAPASRPCAGWRHSG